MKGKLEFNAYEIAKQLYADNRINPKSIEEFIATVDLIHNTAYGLKPRDYGIQWTAREQGTIKNRKNKSKK